VKCARKRAQLPDNKVFEHVAWLQPAHGCNCRWQCCGALRQHIHPQQQPKRLSCSLKHDICCVTCRVTPAVVGTVFGAADARWPCQADSDVESDSTVATHPEGSWTCGCAQHTGRPAGTLSSPPPPAIDRERCWGSQPVSCHAVRMSFTANSDATNHLLWLRLQSVTCVAVMSAAASCRPGKAAASAAAGSGATGSPSPNISSSGKACASACLHVCNRLIKHRRELLDWASRSLVTKDHRT
jgi:hypothetical protein